jgi:hypothetical protein
MDGEEGCDTREIIRSSHPASRCAPKYARHELPVAHIVTAFRRRMEQAKNAADRAVSLKAPTHPLNLKRTGLLPWRSTANAPSVTLNAS